MKRRRGEPRKDFQERQRECGNKIPFHSQSGVVAAMISYKRRFPKRANVSSYLCRFCHCWHFGHFRIS